MCKPNVKLELSHYSFSEMRFITQTGVLEWFRIRAIGSALEAEEEEVDEVFKSSAVAFSVHSAVHLEGTTQLCLF